MNEKPLTFLASIAPLQSAYTVAADGGMRIKIDVPETELGQIKRLVALRGKVLRITIETVMQMPQGDNYGATEDTDRYFES